MTQEAGSGQSHRAEVVPESRPTSVEAQLAALTIAVRRMGDVLVEHTTELRKLNDLAAGADGDRQLIEVLERIEKTLAAQTEILNALTMGGGAKPGTARPS